MTNQHASSQSFMHNIQDCLQNNQAQEAHLLCTRRQQTGKRDAEAWFLLAGINASLHAWRSLLLAAGCGTGSLLRKIASVLDGVAFFSARTPRLRGEL
jgi:hypothetical protein